MIEENYFGLSALHHFIWKQYIFSMKLIKKIINYLFKDHYNSVVPETIFSYNLLFSENAKSKLLTKKKFQFD
jgi:hypothetical protein